MKKTLVALAALAATGAFAQSSVGIDGFVDAGLVQYNYKGTKVTGVDRSLSTTSRVNIRATNDLGGGMTASFVMENDWNPTSNTGNTGATSNSGGSATATGYNGSAATAFGNGETQVALSGASFGKISFGTLAGVGSEYVSGTSQSFNTNMGSNYGTALMQATINNAYRNDNSFRYDTPVMSGVSGTLLYRAQQTTATTTLYSSNLGGQDQSKIMNVGLRYDDGTLKLLAGRVTEDATNAFGAAASLSTVTAGSAGTVGTMNVLGARYQLSPVLLIQAGYQGISNVDTGGTTQRNTKDFTFGGTYKVGANMFMAQYNRITGPMSNAINLAGTGGNASAISLGYEYALSKTTAIVARYSKLNDDAVNKYYLPVGGSMPVASVAGNNSVSKFGAGLRVGF